MYTNKHTQWFYFRVRNMKAGVAYRFTITNLMKGRSLYSLGMKPLLYSERAAEEKGVGWHRIGSNIKYYRNSSQAKPDNNVTVALYSLTWTCQFPYDSDTCYLAHCYPYTYSHLQHYLSRVTSNPAVSSYCKLRVLCRSLAGNNVYVLTITSPVGSCMEGGAKKAVVVTGRVHPGETNGSWMMEGFLDFLLGDSDDAQILRDTFVFKVVPMLNPDGVVVGNYRCSLAGRDLNRNYKTILRDSFPCVWHTRNMVKRLVAERDVVLYCDFHGHSHKNNVFMYGCNHRGNAALQLHERVFPLMMSKNVNDKFSFRSCKFRVQKSKEGTGRIVMWRLGIRNSYTMECTFGGSTLGNRRGTHFTTRDMKSLGYYFCDTLLDYCDPDPTKTAYCLTELEARLRQEVRERLGKELDTDCNISVSDLETSTSGSNSTDSDGPPVHLMNQPDNIQQQKSPVRKKKKRLRTHKDRNRLWQDRVKNSTEPKVLHSSIKNIKPSLVKVRMQERTVVREKKREQRNSINKPGAPRSASDLDGISHVTLWQGSEPVQDKECREAMRAEYLYRRAKAFPQLSTYTTLSPDTEKPQEETGWCKCSAQLLHLCALHPRQLQVAKPAELQHRLPAPSFVYHKGLRGRLSASVTAAHRSPSGMYLKVVPPAKCLMSSYPDNSTSLPLCIDRNALRVSARHFVLEDSFTDTINSKRHSQNQEENTTEVQRFKDKKMVNQRELKLREELGEDVTAGSAVYNQRLFKNCEERKGVAILPPLSRPSGLIQTESSPSHCDRFSQMHRLVVPKDSWLSCAGRQSRGRTAPQEQRVTRSSQSAPL
ncbi:cytosolic carboxypeptidase 2 [Myripristis murdjan]|uniref:cytosolic carboxypeptidase 2 n=1 Tax=Myripristis murdjan TaxID=586833 RepID=UPI0011761D82|nr:cytosolic carboxypeptidase 2-like [Myripristis murdjan]